MVKRTRFGRTPPTPGGLERHDSKVPTLFKDKDNRRPKLAAYKVRGFHKEQKDQRPCQRPRPLRLSISTARLSEEKFDQVFPPYCRTSTYPPKATPPSSDIPKMDDIEKATYPEAEDVDLKQPASPVVETSSSRSATPLSHIFRLALWQPLTFAPGPATSTAGRTGFYGKFLNGLDKINAASARLEAMLVFSPDSTYLPLSHPLTGPDRRPHFWRALSSPGSEWRLEVSVSSLSYL